MAKTKKDGNAHANGTVSNDASSTEAGEKPVKKRSPKNKTQAIKRALRRLGWDARPSEVQNWVWKNYRMEMDKSYISTIKSFLSRQEREREGGQPTSVLATANVENAPADDPESVSIAELRVIRDLVARIGAERFRDLADLFAC